MLWFETTATGLIVSRTVTETFAEFELPLWSCTVNKILFTPVLAQLNTDWLNTLLVIEQLSVLALSNNPAFIIACPFADK